MFSDDSEAEGLPYIDVYRTSDDTSLSGKGAILDDLGIDLDTRMECSSSSGTLTFIFNADSSLVCGSSYLLINSRSSTHHTIFGKMFTHVLPGPEKDLFSLSGISVGFHRDPLCIGEPDAVCRFDSYDHYMEFDGDLQAGVRYYIRVSTVDAVSFQEFPPVYRVGFEFSVDMSYAHKVSYYEGGELVDERILMNGDKWSFPDVSREGSNLLGWYDVPDPSGGTLYRVTDTVDLEDDVSVYARWWDGGSRTDDYVTPGGNSVHIRVDVSQGGITMDLLASSPDGSVKIDMPDTDLSQPTLAIRIDISSPEGVFTVSEAEMAVDLYGSVSGWLRDRGVFPVADVAVTEGNAHAEPSALGILSESYLSFRVSDRDGADLLFSPGALGTVYRYAEDLGLLSSEVVITDRIAVDSDFTRAQRRAIGDNLAYVFSVVIDGVEIHEFDGPVTITIPYEPGYAVKAVHVHRMNDDGSRVSVPSEYDGKNVTVVVDHLSVYEVTDSRVMQDHGCLLWIVMIIVTILTLNLLRMGCRGAAYTMPRPKAGWAYWFAVAVIVVSVAYILYLVTDLLEIGLPDLGDSWPMLATASAVLVLSLNLIRGALRGSRR